MFFSLLIEGIAVGSIYSLVAVGFIILVQTTDVVNFAHGDLLMFSTFIAYMLIVQTGLPILVGIGLTIIFAALMGVLIEKVLIKPIIDRAHEAVILATLGLAFIFRGLQLFFGVIRCISSQGFSRITTFPLVDSESTHRI